MGVLLAMVVLDILATLPLAIAVDMVDMVVDISESVPLMPSQRLRLMLSMVLMDMVAMVVLDLLATPPLAIAVDMDMDVDSDIMVKYFQSIDYEFGNDLPNTNNIMVFI